MITIEKTWRQIRNWYESNVNEPPYPNFFNWGDPATEEEIKDLEETLEYAIPDDVRKSYMIYNGDNKQDVLPGGYLMDLAEVATTWKMFKEPVDQGLFDDSDANPKGPIKAIWWNPQWIPILHNGGGDYHCVDMDPDNGGEIGQFIKFQHETGPLHIIAPSFEDFLTTFAEDLEGGKYEFDMEKGTVKLR